MIEILQIFNFYRSKNDIGENDCKTGYISALFYEVKLFAIVVLAAVLKVGSGRLGKRIRIG